MAITNGTSIQRRRKKEGQHFLQSPASRTFTLRDLKKMSEQDAYVLFCKLRWPQTQGNAICPYCGSLDTYDITTRQRFKCAQKECRKQFSVTSGTVLAYHKMSFKDLLTAIRAFSINAKGLSAIALSKKIGCDYKGAFVLSTSSAKAWSR